MLKILYIDIETSPVKGWTWGAYDQNVLRIEQDWKLLGFAFAWDDGKVEAEYPTKENRSVPDYYLDWDEGVTHTLWYLLDEADIVIAHNGDRFDVKKINAKFIEHGLGPPSPYNTIDTKKIASQTAMFTRNNLGELGKVLFEDDKMSHSGLDMWFGCMDGNVTEWNRMERYNKKDVVLLRKLYKKLRPWMKNHPHMLDGEVSTAKPLCPRCGSKHTISRKKRRTKAGLSYRAYNCKSCKGWFNDRKMIEKASEQKNS